MSDFGQRTKIEITLEDLDEMRSQIREASDRLVRAEKEKNEALAADPSGRVPQLLAVIEAALPIVQFAVENLEPTTVRGWPHKTLDKLGELLATVDGMSVIAREIAPELRVFAHEAELIELERAGKSGT